MNVTIDNIQGDANSIKITISSRTATLLRVTSYSAILYIWYQGLTLKILRMLPDKHLVHFILELISNCSFVLKTIDGQQSRLRRLKNGVLQGSVLTPLLFNVYVHDLPDTISRKYGYTDDLAILTAHWEWKKIDRTLSQDMSTHLGPIIPEAVEAEAECG